MLNKVNDMKKCKTQIGVIIFIKKIKRKVENTFILERNRSMLEIALKKTSEGRSYQTLRQRSTCADPSLMPLVMVAASMTTFEVIGDTCSQFHQHFTSSFFAENIFQKITKPYCN